MVETYIIPKHKQIVVEMTERFSSIMPQQSRFVLDDKEYFYLPHTEQNVAALAACGVFVYAPIVYYHSFGRHTPYGAQKGAATLLTTYNRGYILNDLGTGKTLSALWAFDWLKDHGQVNRMLVVAPLSTLSDVWEREINVNFPYRSCVVLYGTKSKRQKLLEQKHDIYIINHDGVKVILPELLERNDIDVVCIDELAAFRERRTARWKALQKLTRVRPRVWGMTGVPTPNMPTDAYGQALLVTPDTVSRWSYKRFMAETTFQQSQFTRVAKQGSEKLVASILTPSVRYKLEDCVDIPETVYSYRKATMTSEQTRRYKEMMDKMRLLNEDVVAANEGVKLFKLVQIACGFAYKSNGSPLYIGNTSRADAVAEILEQQQGKAIIFAPFVEIINMLAKHLNSSLVVHGGISSTKRDIIFNQFRNSLDNEPLIAHPRCMSHGLNLTQATTIIWAAPYTSLETFLQANRRIRRPGQRYTTNVIMIEGSRVERKLYRRLENNKKTQGLLLELLESMTAIREAAE